MDLYGPLPGWGSQHVQAETVMHDIRNPRRNADGSIDVVWYHPDFGPVPFTAVDATNMPDEPEYMREIWAGLMRGDYGPIAEAE